MRVDFYINNKKLDLFEDESFSMITRSKDIRDISKIFGDFSNQFNVPASGINNLILARFYDNSIVSANQENDFRQRQLAAVWVDGLLYKQGVVKYSQGTFQLGKIAHHVLQFNGDVLSLNDRVGETTLGQLNFSDLSHPTNAANVRLGMDYNQALFNNDIIYPLISNSEILNIALLEGGTLNPGAFRPAIRVQQILAKINIRFGLALAFDSALNLDDLYFWLPSQEGLGNLSDDNILVYDSVTGTSPGLINVQTGVIAYSANTMNQVVFFQWDFDITPSTADQWTLQGYSSFSSSSSFDGWKIKPQLFATGSGAVPTAVQFQYDVAQAFTEDGNTYRDRWRFELILEPGTSAAVTLTQSRQLSAIFGQDFVAEKPLFTTDNIGPRFPKMKILDFLIGMSQLFFLVPKQSNLQRVDFEWLAYDNWIDSTPQQDITSLVDMTKHSIQIPGRPKSTIMLFEEPKSWKNKQLFYENRGQGYGDLIIEETLGTAEPFKVELPFESMAYEFYDPYLVGHAFDCPVDYTVAPPLPVLPVTPNFDIALLMIWDRSEEKVSNIDVNGFAGNVLSYKLVNTFDGPVPSNNPPPETTNSLTFRAEDDFLRSVERPGSYEINYNPFIQRLINNTTRIYNFDAVLGAARLVQIDATTIIKIGLKRYFINSMETETLTGKTKFELVNYFTPVGPVPVPPIDWTSFNRYDQSSGATGPDGCLIIGTVVPTYFEGTFVSIPVLGDFVYNSQNVLDPFVGGGTYWHDQTFDKAYQISNLGEILDVYDCAAPPVGDPLQWSTTGYLNEVQACADAGIVTTVYFPGPGVPILGTVIYDAADLLIPFNGGNLIWKDYTNNKAYIVNGSGVIVGQIYDCAVVPPLEVLDWSTTGYLTQVDACNDNNPPMQTWYPGPGIPVLGTIIYDAPDLQAPFNGQNLIWKDFTNNAAYIVTAAGEIVGSITPCAPAPDQSVLINSPGAASYLLACGEVHATPMYYSGVLEVSQGQQMYSDPALTIPFVGDSLAYSDGTQYYSIDAAGLITGSNGYC